MSYLVDLEERKRLVAEYEKLEAEFKSFGISPLHKPGGEEAMDGAAKSYSAIERWDKKNAAALVEELERLQEAELSQQAADAFDVRMLDAANHGTDEAARLLLATARGEDTMAGKFGGASLQQAREEIAAQRKDLENTHRALEQAKDALFEIVKCVRDPEEYGGGTMDDALIDADEILDGYEPTAVDPLPNEAEK